MSRGFAVVAAFIAAAAALAAFAASAIGLPPGGPTDGWPAYGHDAGGTRRSPLTQITRENVGTLKVAWAYHTGDLSDGSGGRRRSGFETTPIVVDGVLYLTTPFNRVVALDPETGRERWTYDPKIDLTDEYGDGLINRGVSTWLDATRQSGQPCRRRLYEATLDARLIAIDATNGRPCADFGEGGQLSLRGVPGFRSGWYHMTSPPAIVDDLVIVGSSIDDNARADMPSGVVRAFDARTGSLKWAWDPMPVAASNGARTSGAANAWSVMAVDPDRHLVFVPTGSASPDYYGGGRPGDDKWANSVVALRAATGEVAWGFQLVHHDLWDYDSAAPPLVATFERNGRRVQAVVQGNKTGFLYVLDRDSGRPVFPVEERQVPPSDVSGETASKTQPFPTAPPALVPQRLSADEAWGATPEERSLCRDAIRRLRNDGLFTPPSVQGTLVFPGHLGGLNWSGYAFDSTRALLVANTNNLAAKVLLIPSDRYSAEAQRNPDSSEYSPQRGAPFGMARRFLQAPSGLPCTPPPWGHLTAVNLATGTIKWQVPLGSMADFGGTSSDAPKGSISLGGPIVTASGLVFIAGTFDPHLRAFDLDTGHELWVGTLPASGHAAPITYQVRANGKQYVVVAAGGHAKITEERQSDTLIAFALP